MVASVLPEIQSLLAPIHEVPVSSKLRLNARCPVRILRRSIAWLQLAF
jgi:hypothetical protein